MDVIDLVLTICLISNPTSCREERLHFENRGGLNNCMFLAPTEIAKMVRGTSEAQVVRWKCDYPSKDLTL